MKRATITLLLLTATAFAGPPATRPQSERDATLARLMALPTTQLSDPSVVQPLLNALYDADRRADGTADDPLYSNAAVRAYLVNRHWQTVLAGRLAESKKQVAQRLKFARFVRSGNPLLGEIERRLADLPVEPLKALATLEDLDRQLEPLQPPPAAEQFKKMRFENGYMCPNDAQLQILAGHLKNKKITISTVIESVGDPSDDVPQTVCKTRDGAYRFYFPWRAKDQPPFRGAGVGHFVNLSGTVIDISDPAHPEFVIERLGW